LSSSQPCVKLGHGGNDVSHSLAHLQPFTVDKCIWLEKGLDFVLDLVVSYLLP